MRKFRDTLFDLFGYSAKVTDVNKDSEGKGTYERYNLVVASDLDDNVLPELENIIENNLIPESAYIKMLPYLEYARGVNFTIYNTEEWRRRVVELVGGWYKIKGTPRAYRLMLQMLGFDTVKITEFYKGSSFDSPYTFDDPNRTFDMTGCNQCVGYQIDLTGKIVTTPEVLKAIESVIRFNEPINAFLFKILYNGGPLAFNRLDVWVDEKGDLNYSNEFDPSLYLELDASGDLHIFGNGRAAMYEIDNNGDLILNVSYYE